jgi:hypothetical protein
LTDVVDKLTALVDRDQRNLDVLHIGAELRRLGRNRGLLRCLGVEDQNRRSNDGGCSEAVHGGTDDGISGRMRWHALKGVPYD